MENKNSSLIARDYVYLVIIVILVLGCFATFLVGRFVHSGNCDGTKASDAQISQLNGKIFLLEQKAKEQKDLVAELQKDAASYPQQILQMKEDLRNKKKEYNDAIASLDKNERAKEALEKKNKALQAKIESVRLEGQKTQEETSLIETRRKNADAKKVEIAAAMQERDERIKGKRYAAHGKMLILRNETRNTILRSWLVTDKEEALKTLSYGESLSKSYEGFNSINIRVEIDKGFNGVEKVETELFAPTNFSPEHKEKNNIKHDGVWIYRLYNGVMMKTQDENAIPVLFE